MTIIYDPHHPDYVNCSYIPGQSEWELDFPRLMLRAKPGSTVRKALERVTGYRMQPAGR